MVLKEKIIVDSLRVTGKSRKEIRNPQLKLSDGNFATQLFIYFRNAT